MRHVFFLLAIPLALAACAEPDAQPVESPPPAVVDLAQWRSESIALPPEFAPGLPRGEERLLFAPGMFEAGGEDYWSYAFLIELERGALPEKELKALLEDYFDGLLRAVAAGRDEEIASDPAQILEWRRTGESSYEAEIRLIDAFVTLELVDLRLLLEVEGAEQRRLRFQASPQAKGHAIWRALEQAAASLEL